MSIACAATLACTTMIALNHNKIFATLAGGITENGNDRVLTFDKDSAVTFNSNHTAKVSHGKMSAFSNYASSIANGLMEATQGNLIIYYDELNGNYYHGFEQATVTSVSVTYKCYENLSLNLYWGLLSVEESSLIPHSEYASTTSITASSEPQTYTFTSGSFFADQATVKPGSPSIYIKATGGMPSSICIYSVSISYTCL